MTYWWFLLVGWIHIRCSHCSTHLTLTSVGGRFWTTLATGAVISAIIFFFVDFPFQLIGERWTLALFIIAIAATLLSAVYFAWRDSQSEIEGDAHQ